jgi:hypothetical protein
LTCQKSAPPSVRLALPSTFSSDSAMPAYSATMCGDSEQAPDE